MKVSALVPTYCRTDRLQKCLEALENQSRVADEVIIVVRDCDSETRTFLDGFNSSVLLLNIVTVTIAGQIAALNAGLAAAQGDIIAITDDDAAPHSDWLKRIEAHFLADETIGGVGGRDWVYHGDQLEDGKKCSVIGQVQWFGQVTGNHHLGCDAPREVEILKGANMSYRKTAIEAIKFDQRLRGTGAQVHNDMAFSLALKRSGWKLIYDPLIAVNHYPAQRFDEDERNKFNRSAFLNQVHNETLILLDYLPPLRRFAFLVWATLVGTSSNLGLVQLLRLLVKDSVATEKWIVSLEGRWQGWQTWRKTGGQC